MKNGQWVLFRVEPDTPVLLDEKELFQPISGAMEGTLERFHIAGDGRYVGIYFSQGEAVNLVIGKSGDTEDVLVRRILPGRVIPVTRDTGLNVRVLVGSSIMGRLVCYRLQDVTDLEAARSRDDLPQERIAARLAKDPDWQPRGHYVSY